MKIRNLIYFTFVFVLFQFIFSKQVVGFQYLDSQKKNLNQDTIKITNQYIKNHNDFKRGKNRLIFNSSAVGIIVGFFGGIAISGDTYYTARQGLKGSLIGSTILPMITYEFFRYRRTNLIKGKLLEKYSDHYIIDKTNYELGISATVGFNNTFLLQDNFHFIEGFSVGLSKDWQSSANGRILGRIEFIERKFRLSDKKIYLTNNNFHEADINFSMSFIDISLLSGFEIPIQGKIKNKLFFGPTISVPLKDKNEIDTKGDYELSNKKDLEYDFTYDTESAPLVSYLNVSICSQIIFNNFLFEAQIRSSLPKVKIIRSFIDSILVMNYSISVGIIL